MSTAFACAAAIILGSRRRAYDARRVTNHLSRRVAEQDFTERAVAMYAHDDNGCTAFCAQADQPVGNAALVHHGTALGIASGAA